MTIKFNELSPKLQAQIRRDNPSAFCTVSSKIAESVGKRRRADKELEQCEAGVRYCITLIALRKRLTDQHDNLPSSFKGLVDKITSWLGFRQDNDPRLKWEYGQQITSGEQGVIVKIERL